MPLILASMIHTPDFQSAWQELLGAQIEPASLYLLYDGDCILCQNAALHYRLNKVAGAVRLIDLRNHLELVSWLKASDLDVNEGVLVLHRGRVYFGARALRYLSALGRLRIPGGVLASRLLSIQIVSNLVYPALKAFRALLNWTRGVGRL